MGLRTKGLGENKDTMHTVVIIPAYNEAQKIGGIVRAIRERGFDVAVVDDGSTDTTSREAAAADATVLQHFVNRGYGAALTTGNAWALANDYNYVVHFDADGQHRAEEIEAMVAPIARGDADVVIGSRFIFGRGKQVPPLRRVLIKMAIVFTWMVSGIKLTDAHNGFRAFARAALEKMDCRQDGMSYSSEVVDQIAERGLHWAEVPVTIVYTDYSRAKGESNVKKILLGLKFLWGKVIK